MAKFPKYALWLMPSGQVYDRLSGLITRLSTAYATLQFEPHVTLLGGLIGPEEEIEAKTLHLSTLIRACTITLVRAEYINEFFRCLFLRAEDTDELLTAHLKARKIFNRMEEPRYMPHLSLMYGDLPAEIKEEIIRDIGKEWHTSFDVKSIHLFSTEGEPKEWHRAKEFALKG